MITANRPLTFHPRLNSPCNDEYAQLVLQALHQGHDYIAEDIAHAVTALFPRASLQPQTIRSGILRAAQLGYIVQNGRKLNARGRSCQLWRATL